MKGVSFLYYTQEQIDRANQADLVVERHFLIAGDDAVASN